MNFKGTTQPDNIEVLFYSKKESIVLCLQLEKDAAGDVQSEKFHNRLSEIIGHA